RKLKHVLGADVLYNNKFLREEYFYYEQTSDNKTTRIDTGSYVKTSNFDKLGLNLHYTLRYELSSRWLVTASATMANKFYRQKVRNSYSNNYSIDMLGLISDISIFYRF